MIRVLGRTDTNDAQTKSRPKQSRIPTNNLVIRSMFIFSVVLLLLIGLVMVYSASSVEALTDPDIGDATYYLKKQLMLIASGLVLCAIAARIPHQAWATWVVWVPWAAVVLMLLATTAMGVAGLGAQRWITLPGIGTFQPSEFAKIAVILVMAKLIPEYLDDGMELKRFLLLAGVAVLVPVALIVFQPDLGTTVIVLLAALFALWFGEVDMRPIILGIVIIAIVGVVFIATSEFRRERVDALFHPEQYTDTTGWQVVNSLYAFGTGGVFGVGLGNSYQKYYYLPEAHTDFIFSIIGEEMGFVGAVVVILLFCLFTYSGIKIAMCASSRQASIIAGAATATIMAQAILNMACTLSLFPVTGKPLPFVSYGGSSMWATLLLVGIVLSVSFDWQEATKAQRRRNDMRILDGGRSSSNTSGSRSNRNSDRKDRRR